MRLAFAVLLACTAAAATSSRARVAVIGGGAAGFFAAIECARGLGGAGRSSHGESVLVLESAPQTLQKVLISGGGRCNVLHDPRKGVPAIAKGYPRGGRELLSPLTSLFSPEDAYEWFEKEGVPLKTERDGRVFPVSDSSASVKAALEHAAASAGVSVRTRCRVTRVESIPCSGGAGERERFRVHYSRAPTGEDAEGDTSCVECDAVIFATGSSATGHKMVAQLANHTIVPAVPSLFSFKIDDKNLTALSGVSGNPSPIPNPSPCPNPVSLLSLACPPTVPARSSQWRRRRCAWCWPRRRRRGTRPCCALPPPPRYRRQDPCS